MVKHDTKPAAAPPDERRELTFGKAWNYAPAPESTDHFAIAQRYGLFLGG